MRTVQQIEAEQKERMAHVAAQLAAGVPFDQIEKGPSIHQEWLDAKKREQKHYSAVCRAIDNPRSN